MLISKKRSCFRYIGAHSSTQARERILCNAYSFFYASISYLYGHWTVTYTPTFSLYSLIIASCSGYCCACYIRVCVRIRALGYLFIRVTLYGAVFKYLVSSWNCHYKNITKLVDTFQFAFIIYLLISIENYFREIFPELGLNFFWIKM